MAVYEKVCSFESGYGSVDMNDSSDSVICKREPKESVKLIPESESASAYGDGESNSSAINFKVDTSSPSDEQYTDMSDMPSSEHSLQTANEIDSDTARSSFIEEVDHDTPELDAIRKVWPEILDRVSHGHILPEFSVELYSKRLIDHKLLDEINETTGSNDYQKALRLLSVVESKLKFNFSRQAPLLH